MQATIAEVKDNVGKRIEDVVLHGNVPGRQDELLSKGDQMALKRCVLAAQRTNLPRYASLICFVHVCQLILAYHRRDSDRTYTASLPLFSGQAFVTLRPQHKQS